MPAVRVDRSPRGLGGGREVHRAHAGAVVTGEQVEERGAERLALLPVQRLRDLEPDLLSVVSANARPVALNAAASRGGGSSKLSVAAICGAVSPREPAYAIARASEMPYGESASVVCPRASRASRRPAKRALPSRSAAASASIPVMLRLLGLVISIGLADSMNPTTIAPALYLASGRDARKNVTQFTVATFAVFGLGGALILLGPGQALLAIVPKPGATAQHIAELVAGAVMLGAAAVLWRRRETLARRELPTPKTQGRSSAVLGLTISVVELPTAFPYFAAIAAIVGSGYDLGRQLLFLALYNVCFVLPLLLIIATLTVAGDRAAEILTRARRFLQRHWPKLLAALALLAGVFVTLLGATGLASGGHGALGRISRRFQRLLHHH
jgi:cytochrome c biogenesis protein CcdA